MNPTWLRLYFYLHIGRIYLFANIFCICGSEGKASVYNVRDLGSIPGLGRFPGEGNGNLFQYSCLENPMDVGAWCRLLSMGSQRVGHDWMTSLSLYDKYTSIFFFLVKSLYFKDGGIYGNTGFIRVRKYSLCFCFLELIV